MSILWRYVAQGGYHARQPYTTFRIARVCPGLFYPCGELT